MSTRLYDLVMYGASSFVGQQVVQYLSDHAEVKGLRWAIAGRNRERLEAVKRQVGGRAEGIDVWVADSSDQQAVDQFVSQAQVVLNTAGPFAQYGTPVVDACVRFKTHYVDITGETPWVRDLITTYHERAAAEGTQIVPCCGFDSVPSDLGAYLVVQAMRERFGESCGKSCKVRGYFQGQGGFNGGTLASGFNLYDSNQMDQVGDPFLLNPPGMRPGTDPTPDPTVPFYDSEIGAWVGPFLMGPINTRVVRRSSALFEQWLQPYGPGFDYQEYMKFDEPWGWLKAAGVTAGLGFIVGAMSIEPGRQLLRSLAIQPGKGPSEETMNQGWFWCELMGQSEDGQKVHGLISGQGDPGNRATVKFLCESALGLILNGDELPGGQELGGILTPATAFGEVLAKRLRDAGVTISVGENYPCST